MDCASDQLLYDFAERALDAQTSASVREHLIACHDCRRRFAAVRSQVEAMKSLREGAVRSEDQELLANESWFEHLRQACVAEMQTADAAKSEPVRGFALPGWVSKSAPVAAALLIGLGLGLWSQPGGVPDQASSDLDPPREVRTDARTLGSGPAPSLYDDQVFPLERTRVVRMDVGLPIGGDPVGHFGLGSRPNGSPFEPSGSGSLVSAGASGEPSVPESPDPTPTTPNRR